MLSTPAFMKNGGVLGFHCAHQYAHTDGMANQRLPHALKGIDVVLFTIFRTLGLTVHVRPILDKEFSEDEFLPASRITRAAPEFPAIKIVGEDTYWELDDNEVRDTTSRRELNWGDGGTAEIAEQVAEFWGGYEIFKDVLWINEQVDGKGEVALAFQQWVGNETETGWWYSFVAILVEIPVFSQRKLDKE
jgi:hypothetical protein